MEGEREERRTSSEAREGVAQREGRARRWQILHTLGARVDVAGAPCRCALGSPAVHGGGRGRRAA